MIPYQMMTKPLWDQGIILQEETEYTTQKSD